jgi:hypothetical protein
MDTQREELAKRGIDHDDYEIFLAEGDSIDDETTGIMVRQVKTGNQIEGVIPKSRRQLAEPGDTTYFYVIVDMVHRLEKA